MGMGLGPCLWGSVVIAVDSALLNVPGGCCLIAGPILCFNVGMRCLPGRGGTPTIVCGVRKNMQKTRRARAIAIALVKDDAKLRRLRLLAITIGATATLLALPFLFH